MRDMEIKDKDFRERDRDTKEEIERLRKRGRVAYK